MIRARKGAPPQKGEGPTSHKGDEAKKIQHHQDNLDQVNRQAKRAKFAKSMARSEFGHKAWSVSRETHRAVFLAFAPGGAE